MSVEWTGQEKARPVEYLYRATVEGLELTVTDEGRWGVRWTVQCYLDDFALNAHGFELKTVEEAQAAATAAAHRLLELGARGQR